MLIIVDAETQYCDRELFIYLVNNNLEDLMGCINFPDIQQDTQLELLDQRVDVIENRTLINSTVVR